MLEKVHLVHNYQRSYLVTEETSFLDTDMVLAKIGLVYKFLSQIKTVAYLNQ